jgi:cell shape-determining protein MreC
MIRQFRDKKQISRRKNIIKNAIIFALVIIIFVGGILAWSGKLFHYVGRPIWKAQNLVTNAVEDQSYLVRTKSSVFKENEALKKANADLQNSMIDYQIVKTENDQLKELLGRLPAGHTFTLSAILAKPNRSPYDTIIIDVGDDVGITEGQQVFASGDVPIGEISKVYDHDSLVMLYSNPGQVTEGMIEGSNASVELIGRGGGNFEMNVPLDLPSLPGTMVILPNTETQIIAIVDAVISVPTDPIKKVILHSPINVQSLKWVEVKRD